MKLCEQILKNIAGRLPKNSRTSIVDLKSQNKEKKDQKIFFSLRAEMLYFD